MIKITGAGWSTITLNSKEVCEGGYITDIPNDFLDGFIYLLSGKQYRGVVITAHLEPCNFFLVLSTGFCEENNYYEITEGNRRHELIGERVYLNNVNYVEMAKELIEDIENDLDNWAGFSCDICGKTKEEAETKFLRNKNKIIKKIEKLIELVYLAQYKKSLRGN